MIWVLGDNPRASVAKLDNTRLGRLPSDALNIYRDIRLGKKNKFTEMWDGNERLLVDYGFIALNELAARHFALQRENYHFLSRLQEQHVRTLPWWQKQLVSIILSHKLELVRRDPSAYGRWLGMKQDYPQIAKVGIYWPTRRIPA